MVAVNTTILDSDLRVIAANPDCATPDDLMTLWHLSSRSPLRTARRLFPHANARPKGYVRAVRDLGNYAANKATAMRERAAGRVQTAQQYEDICESIYKKMPAFIRW